jgi:ketosteroid isomerase-like protein
MMPTRALSAGLLLLSLSAAPLAQTGPSARARGGRTPAPAASARSEEQALVQLERDWDAAFQRKDTRFLAGMLADEFIVTYGDGTRGDKAKEISLAENFNQQVDSRTLDDFTVKVFGDTAVVWFSQRLTGPRQGKPVTVTYRYTDVFVRRAGRWQAVSSHSTRVGERPRD